MHDVLALAIGCAALALSAFNTWWLCRSLGSPQRLWRAARPDTAPLGFSRRSAA